MAISLALRVDTDKLKAQAALVEEAVSSIERDLETLHQAMEATKGYWKGEASEAYRASDENFWTDSKDLLTRLKRYAPDIQRMAGIYETAEEGNVSTASQLSPSVELV